MTARPIPTNLRVMHDLPVRRGPNSGGVRTSPPDPPEWLPQTGKDEWNRVLDATAAHPTWIQAADLAGLAAYCAAWSTWESAARIVAAEGPLVPARSTADQARGAMVKHPALQVMRDASQQLRAWSRELGFTPDSRGRVDVGALENDDEARDVFG